ncbi:MAG: PAS domain S-box protein [Candidatus Nanopelagicales bacterium]
MTGRATGPEEWLAALRDVVYVLRLEPDRAFEFVSDAVTDLVGYTPAEHYADPDLGGRLVVEEDLPLLAALAATPVGDPVEVTLRWCARDGRVVWTQHRCVTRRREDGSLVLVGSARDVTDQVRDREALERTRAEFQLLAENVPGVVFSASADGVFEWVSPSVEPLLGLRPQDIVGRVPTDLVHPDDLARRRAFGATVRAGTSVSFRARYRTSEDSYRWLDVALTPVLDESGHVVRQVGTWRDVQAEVDAEAALERSRDEFRVLAENASDLVARTDLDGTITWISESIRGYGWRPTEMVGRHASELLHPDDRHLWHQVAETTGRGQTAHVEWRAAGNNDPAAWHWFRVRMSPVIDRDGHVTGTVSGWQDIDAEMAAREALLESEARYRLLAENSGDVVLTSSLDRTLTYASPSVTAVLGWDPLDLVGTPLMDLIHPDDVPTVTAVRARTSTAADGLATGRARVLCKDGSFRWIGSIAREVRAPDGSPVGAIAAWRDIQAQVDVEERLTASHRRFSHMFAEHEAIMLLIEPTSGDIVDANQAAARFYGYDVATLRTMRVTDLNTLSDDEVAHDREEALAGRVNAFVFPHRLADGTVRTVEVHSSPIDDGDRTLLFSIVRDVTDDLAALEALALSERRYRLLTSNMGDIVVELDLRGTLTFLSPSVTTLLGWEPRELVGTALLDLVHPDDVATVTAGQALSHERSDGVASAHARLRQRDGTYRWIGGVVREVRDDDGAPIAAVAVLRDIDSEVHAQQALARQARTDDLTGLLNRAEVMTRLAAILSHPPRVGQRIGILFVDLDGLKTVNDTRGHAAGDLLLTTTAARIAALVRDGDLVARVGGDEVLVLLPGVSVSTDATNVAEKLRRAIAEPIPTPDAGPITSTASIGVALAHPGDDVDSLIARADMAMYAAKQRGGNRTETR